MKWLLKMFDWLKGKKMKKRPHYYQLMEDKYKWLCDEDIPILQEALNWYGTLELKGDANNPVIIEWAKEVGGWIGSWYKQDSIPWCGLYMAMVAKRAGYKFTQKALSALAWASWGASVDIKEASLGDVLVFTRKGGGHVGLYVGEDESCYHVLGGNQADAVSITRIRKIRIKAVRRCLWLEGEQPDAVRSILLSNDGTVSNNEK